VKAVLSSNAGRAVDRIDIKSVVQLLSSATSRCRIRMAAQKWNAGPLSLGARKSAAFPSARSARKPTVRAGRYQRASLVSS
jgi:hypothetical protein